MGDASSIEYRIKTTADVRGLQDVEKGLKEQIKLAKEAGRSAAVFERELNKVNAALNTQAGKLGQDAVALEKTMAAMKKARMDSGALAAEHHAVLQAAGLKRPSALRSAGNAFMDAGGGLGGVRAAAGTFGAGAAAGVGGVVAATALGVKALKEYADAQERVMELDAALAQQGHGKESYRQELHEKASNLQDATGVKDDDWMAALTKLTQFGAGPDRINEAVEAAKNLAGILKGDLTTASMMVGKALNGEYDQFSRLGIQLDDHMSDAQKLATIYQELAKRGGGMLEASNDSLNGSFRRLKNGVGDFMEGVGSVIAHMLPWKDMANGLGGALSAIGGGMEGVIEKSGKVQTAVDQTSDAMVDASTRNRLYAESFDKIKEKAADSNAALSEFNRLVQDEADAKIAEAQALRDQKIAIINEQEKAGALKPMEAEIRRGKANEEFEKLKHKTTDQAQALKAAQLRAEAQENQKPISEAALKVAAEEQKLSEMKATADRQAKIRDAHAEDIEKARTALIREDPNDPRDAGAAFYAAKGAVEAAEKKMEEELAATGGGKLVTAKAVKYQEDLIKEDQKHLEEKRRQFGPVVAQQMSDAAALDRQRTSAKRVESINETTRAIGRGENLRGVRTTERGEVKALAGGGFEGPESAVKFEQEKQRDRQQLNQIIGNGDQARVQSIMQYLEGQRAAHDRQIDLLSKSQNLTAQVMAKIARLEDNQARLESVMQNLPGR